jgi:protein-S-isoprenylcysteine O-methyltransferase Ste14
MAEPIVFVEDPVLELRGLAGRIDLSAWVSGLSFVAGVYMANLDHAATVVTQTPWTGATILVAFAIFFGLILLIQRHMRFSLTATTYGQPPRLVTSGVFSYSRNPIYVAFLIPLISLAAISVPAALAAIVLYVGAINATIIRSEERHLLAAFGAEYARYYASVPRWFLFN